MNKSLIITEPSASYVFYKIMQENDLDTRLRKETSKLPKSIMISSSDVGALLSLLVKSINAKTAIEIGTYTGYTALKIAAALPSNGKLICCDINKEWASVGQKYWKEAHLDNKIDLQIAPALQTLEILLSNHKEGTFDFAFIDADKENYDGYYENCLRLLRPGGLIVLDNMLWQGKVADDSKQDEETVSLRNLNKKISQDKRIEHCLMTVADGLMLVRKK